MEKEQNPFLGYRAIRICLNQHGAVPDSASRAAACRAVRRSAHYVPDDFVGG
ncbi:MAG: putative PEP-binding protein [Butyricicoccaceae bacterium]